MTVASGKYLANVLAAKIGRNIIILADTFANDDYYLSAATNFPNMSPTTINDVLNGNLLTDELDSNMGNLNKFLSALNSVGPPANTADHTHYCSLSRSITTASR